MIEKEYQYIIIGSGVAGITISKLLLEKDRNTSILMLEAGPGIESKNRRLWWDYVTRSISDPFKKEDWEYLPYSWTYDQIGEYKSSGNPGWYFGDQRMIARGGSTMHWGGWAHRFKPEDFIMYQLTKTGVDWPITYDDLEPFYCKAEEYLCVCGDSNEEWGSGDLKMWRSKPYALPPYPWTAPETEMAKAFDLNGIKPGRMPLARYRKCLTTGTCKYCPIGARFSADQVIDEVLSDKRNQRFVLQVNAPVTRILADSKERMRGVEFLDSSRGEIVKVDGGTIIVCAGTIESPKILMLSTSSFWENGIGNDNLLVGKNLVSHSQIKVTGTRVGNDERWFQEYDFPSLMSRTFDSPEYQKKGKIFLYNNRKLPNFDFAQQMIDGHSRAEIDKAFIGSRQTGLEAFFEDKGRPDNFVTISGTRKTRLGLPMTEIQFTRPPDVTAVTDEWRLVMENIVRSIGYDVKSVTNKPGGHHATGTCRMGYTPDDSVTDKDLRVHRTKNLYICSNATFPTCSAVNPTLTLTAMAIRLAEHLTNDC